MDSVLVENGMLCETDAGGSPIYRRVLWIPKGNTRLVLAGVAPRESMPNWVAAAAVLDALRSGLWIVAETDPLAPTWSDADLTDAERQCRDRRWMVIHRLVTDPDRLFNRSSRYRFIQEVARTCHVSDRAVLKWLYVFWRHGQTPDALVPRFDRCGAPGTEREPGTAKRGRPCTGSDRDHPVGINVSPDLRKTLREVGTRYIKAGHSSKNAYWETLKEVCGTVRYEDGLAVPTLPPADECPTEWQFGYALSKGRSREAEIRAVIGDKAFELTARSSTGTSAHLAPHPGAVYQIDATVGNIYLLSALHADSDEAGRVFRFEGGHRSDVKPASIPRKAAGVACPREAFSCGTSVASGQAAMLVSR